MIDKLLRCIELVCFDNALQIDQRTRTCARNRTSSKQQVYVVQARHPGATIEPECTYFVPRPASHIWCIKHRLAQQSGDGRYTATIPIDIHGTIRSNCELYR